MNAQEALRTALKDILGPEARRHGYKGSAPTWRRATSEGHWAVVNVQSSSWSTRESLRCVVNLAFAPEPWLRWTQERLGTAMPKTVNESLGLYRARLHPEGTPPGVDGWWEVIGAHSARSAVQDMADQLSRHGWPVLEDLARPGAMLEQVRQGDLGFAQRQNLGVFFARAEALLLMDSGEHEALEEQLAFALGHVVDGQEDSARQFDAWVRKEHSRTR